MSEDNIQLQIDIGVMKEQLRTLTDDMKEARHSRKNAYIAQEKRDELLLKIDHRLEKVELFIVGASPTLQEFNTLKLKAQGAGAAGKLLWFVAGASITVAASVAAFWQNMFGK